MAEQTTNSTGCASCNSGAKAGFAERSRAFATMAKLVGKRGAVGGIRTIIPLLEGYARTMQDKVASGETPTISKGGALNFSDDEMQVLRGTGEKFTYELIEIASITHPIMDNAPPYKAVVDPETGRYPPLHLAHLLSLVKAGRELLADEDVAVMMKQDSVQMDSAGQGLYTGMQNDAVLIQAGPQPTQTIRRLAMSNQQDRNYLVSQQGTQVKEYRSTQAAVKSSTASEFGDRFLKCATQALCDTLNCIVAEYVDSDHSFFCEDENGTGANQEVEICHCLDMFVYSLIRCLPSSLCPSKPLPPAQPKPPIHCNYAVEEDL